MERKICIIGIWHQGAVAAACLADFGYEVIATDNDREKIEKLKIGKAPIYEPGLDDLIKKNLHSKKLKFSTDIAGSVKGNRYIFIMFDTKIDENDSTDLDEIFETFKEIAPNLENDSVIIVSSQVPIGTCDNLFEVIRQLNPKLKFNIAYIPENLRLGQAINLFLNPNLPIIGADNNETFERVKNVLSVIQNNWKCVSVRTAEMTKHALNAFLGTTITFGNELGNLCDELGVDGKQLAEVLRMEPRIGAKAMLLPGLGFSGGTIARDIQTLRAIGDKCGLQTTLLDSVWQANKNQNKIVIKKIRKIFGTLEGIRVTVLGLTYKPNTSTLRRSASLEIISDLIENGVYVKAYDPKANKEELACHKEFDFMENVYDAVKESNALVIITPWEEYKNLDFAKIKNLMIEPLIIDTNNLLDSKQLEEIGYNYIGTGRGKKL